MNVCIYVFRPRLINIFKLLTDVAGLVTGQFADKPIAVKSGGLSKYPTGPHRTT